MKKFLPLPLLAGLVLAGCQTQEFIELRTQTVAERHPITVAPAVRELRLVPDPVTRGLTSADRARLAAFVAEFAGRGEADISVAAPDGSANARLAAQTAADIRKMVTGMGLPASRVRLGSYPAALGDAAAPVVISYVAYMAKGPECGDFSQNLGFVPLNAASPNFGCATQANFAAMVADPRDLLMPRAETPGDAGRRATVLQRYRAGQATQTQRMNDERGVVSTVGSN